MRGLASFAVSDAGTAYTGAVTLTTASPTVVPCDATSAAFTVTLPTTTIPGLIFYIKKMDASANAVTVASTSIDGAATVALSNRYDCITVESTTTSGTWRVLDKYSSSLSGTAGGDLSGTYPNPTVVKINGTSLAGLATGILKNTTGTGVPSIAVAADIPVAATTTASGPADNTAVVHTSGAENISGGKTFLTAVGIGSAALQSVYFWNRGANFFDPQTITATGTLSAFAPLYNNIDATSGAVTLTLPTTTVGATYVFRRVDATANVITIAAPAGGSIDGAASITLDKQYDTVWLTIGGTSGAAVGTYQVIHRNGVGSWVDLGTTQSITGQKQFANRATFTNVVWNETSRTANVTLATTSNIIQVCDATTAAFTVTLPATTTAGIIYLIKKTDSSANSVTVAATSIEGAASIALTHQYDVIAVESTTTSGTWRVLWRSPTVGSWVSLTLDSGYSANTFGYTPAYRVTGSKVELRGNIKLTSGSFVAGSNTAVTTLPTAIQPSKFVELVGAVTYVAGAATAVRVEIAPANGVDGSTGPTLKIVTPTASGSWCSLDGMSYELV